MWKTHQSVEDGCSLQGGMRRLQSREYNENAVSYVHAILITIFVTAKHSQCITFHPCYILFQKNEILFMLSAFLSHKPPQRFIIFFTDALEE